VAASLTLAVCPGPVEAWPADLSQRIARDALRLVPKSLAELFVANEAEIFADGKTSKMPALAIVYKDLPAGRLSGPGKTALSEEFAERAKALQGGDFRGAVIALGATYRLAVDLSDPGLGARLGSDARGRGIRREFYLFVNANVDKIPVVVVAPESLRIGLEGLPGFLGEVLSKTEANSALLRAEGQEDGRVLPFSEIDFRSPVFAVASTAYSRSVSAVAATWIAIWRHAGGDMKRQKAPKTISPRPTIFSPTPLDKDE
jgi:hypothetical protein